MFNSKKLSKLQIRPPSLFLLIIKSRIGECFPAESWEVRNSNDDDDDDDDKEARI
jgi:hypothetical protein